MPVELEGEVEVDDAGRLVDVHDAPEVPGAGDWDGERLGRSLGEFGGPGVVVVGEAAPPRSQQEPHCGQHGARRRRTIELLSQIYVFVYLYFLCKQSIKSISSS